MEPNLKRHLQVHLSNPHINYIQCEDCKYCKLDRRLQYGKRLQFPRTFRRPQVISNYNLESSYFYHLTDNSFHSNYNYPERPSNPIRPSNPVPPPNHTINRSVTRTLSQPRNVNLPRITNRNQVPIFEFYNLEEYQPPELSVRDLNVNTSISIYLRGNNPPEKCSICYENLRSFQIVRELSCGHKFHQKCVDKWFENKDTCPLCRYCLLDTDL